MPNPYQFRSDIDDDIARSSKTKLDETALHTFDGERCLKCGRTHDLFIANTALPIAIAAQLSEFLDTLPPELLDLAVVGDPYNSATISYGFNQFSRQVRGVNAQSSLILAVATILDRQTDGEVARLYSSYRAEAMVANVHVLRKLLKQYITRLQKDEREGKLDVPPRIMRALTEVDAEVARQLEHAVTHYRETSEAASLPVDEATIADGIPTPERPFANEMLVEVIEGELQRQADAHHDHHHHDHNHEYHEE